MEKNYASLRQLDRHGQGAIRVYPNREADDYPAHWHMKYEIILPVSESYSAVVDGQSYDLVPGEVLVIPAGVVHEIFAPDQGMRYIFMVDQDVVYRLEGLAGIQHFFYPCVHLRAGQEDAVLREARDCLMQAVRERENRQMLDQAAIQAWIGLFLIRVARWLMQGAHAGPDERRPHMNEAFLDICAYITEHCNEKLTLEDVAAYSGYSKYHFSRIFKEYTGMSFYEFYLRQRMLLCRQLLNEKNLSVTEVASRAGFGSLATFNRVFKQYEGVTPTQYRQLKQIKGMSTHHGR